MDGTRKIYIFFFIEKKCNNLIWDTKWLSASLENWEKQNRLSKQSIFQKLISSSTEQKLNERIFMLYGLINFSVTYSSIIYKFFMCFPCQQWIISAIDYIYLFPHLTNYNQVIPVRQLLMNSFSDSISINIHNNYNLDENLVFV